MPHRMGIVVVHGYRPLRVLLSRWLLPPLPLQAPESNSIGIHVIVRITC